jgi:hypothetical protein
MPTREQWLQDITGRFRPWFESAGHPLPEVRVSAGFPSKGSRSKAIGECWSPTCSEDGLSQIFIHPRKKDTVEVCAILAHELIHAAAGLKCKHHGNFAKLATSLGLLGPMTATTAGPVFVESLTALLDGLGDYPHAQLVAGNTSAGKKQTTRMIKASCHGCGYTVRSTAQWLSKGYPICPTCMEVMQ